MLDFWTAVWWENTCSGLDRHTKADKCIQYWIRRFKKGDGRIAAGICSLASGCFWQESAVRLYLLYCTFDLLTFPKGLEGHPGQDQLHGCRCKEQGQEHWRTSSGTVPLRRSPKQSLLGFGQVFCRRLWRLAPKHCQVLGDVQKRMSLFDAELKDARKLTEKMQQETSVAVWASIKSDSETWRRIQKLNLPLAISRHFPNTTVTFEDWPSAAKENMMLNWSNREI